MTDREARLDELKRRIGELSRRPDEENLAPPPVSTHEGRVWFVFDLMLSGSFARGRTSRALAKQWGLSESYVRGVSGEASRLYKTFYLSDPEELELLALRARAAFEELFTEARAMAAEHGPYALKVAGEMLVNMLTYAGVQPAQGDEREHAAVAGAVIILPPKDPEPEFDDEAPRNPEEYQ